MTPVFDKIFKSAVKFCSKHSVEIAMGAAAVGVGLTIFTTAKATLKVNDIVHDDTLTKKEKVKKSVMPVAPAVASVALAYAGITAMYICGRKRQAALLALLTSTQQVFQQYRNARKAEIGVNDEKKEYDNAVCEANDFDEKIPDVPVRYGEDLYCDSITGEWTAMTPVDFEKARYEINRRLAINGFVDFDEWIELIGCDSLFFKQAGGYGWLNEPMGWSVEGINIFDYRFIEIDIVEHEAKDGRVYNLITYSVPPHRISLGANDGEIDICEEDELVLNPCVDTDLWKKTSSKNL